MKLAKETGTPLVPVSSGGPHFYGDTVPSTGDAVIVDLSGMKKVDLIDPFERVASMVEPGVTFGELIPAVAKEGLRLNMPLQPRATKSVVGSMLSREPVIMPHYHWDISDPIGSTEVVFGTGDMFRTGAAAGPGDIAEQRAGGGVQKEAAGPSAMSLHRLLQGAQGTMGIVTWASVRCELIPEREQPYFIASSDVAKLLRGGPLADPPAARQRAADPQRRRLSPPSLPRTTRPTPGFRPSCRRGCSSSTWAPTSTSPT